MEGKVFCPYCPATDENPNGEEMVLADPQQFRGKGRDIFLSRYICLKCQSSSPVMGANTQVEAADKASAAARRRCVPRLNPLTWWEAVEDDRYLEIKGDEYIDMALLQFASFTDGKIEPCDKAVYKTLDEDELPLYGVDYGKTWRCWERRPTEEERASAKWEGTDEQPDSMTFQTKKQPDFMTFQKHMSQIVEEIAEKAEQPSPQLVAKGAKDQQTEIPDNEIIVSGYLEQGLKITHEVAGEPFYEGTLLNKRRSGTIDRISVVVPGRVMSEAQPDFRKKILIRGQIRSYGRDEGHLYIKVFVRSMQESQEAEDVNEVKMLGSICKPSVYRVTPFGREICDMLVEVQTSPNKTSRVPCIAWGIHAQWASRLWTGRKVRISGRLQSREYQQQLESGANIDRTVCEVSVFNIRREDGW